MCHSLFERTKAGRLRPKDVQSFMCHTRATDDSMQGRMFAPYMRAIMIRCLIAFKLNSVYQQPMKRQRELEAATAHS